MSWWTWSSQRVAWPQWQNDRWVMNWSSHPAPPPYPPWRPASSSTPSAVPAEGSAAGPSGPWSKFKAGVSITPPKAKPGKAGHGVASSLRRSQCTADAVNNWKRGLKKRLQEYLDANGGWANCDIDSFIASDCNHRVHVEKHKKKAEETPDDHNKVREIPQRHRLP